MSQAKGSVLHGSVTAKVAGGIVVLSGVGLAVAHATPAHASASGCTAAGNGWLAYQCMVIEGNGQSVHTAQESFSNGLSPTNICSYNAKWHGDSTADGWVTFYGNYNPGCTFGYAVEVKNLSPKKFVTNSGFYGYWKCNDTNGNYQNPVKEIIH